MVLRALSLFNSPLMALDPMTTLFRITVLSIRGERYAPPTKLPLQLMLGPQGWIRGSEDYGFDMKDVA